MRASIHRLHSRLSRCPLPARLHRPCRVARCRQHPECPPSRFLLRFTMLSTLLYRYVRLHFTTTLSETRPRSGLRVHGSRHRGHAKESRLLCKCYANIEGCWCGQRPAYKDFGEGDPARQTRDCPRWLWKIPRNLVRHFDRLEELSYTTLPS